LIKAITMEDYASLRADLLSMIEKTKKLEALLRNCSVDVYRPLDDKELQPPAKKMKKENND
jgi:hypothetical protein